MIALREQSRGVLSSFMFLPGRLPMPTRDVDVWEHATLLFCEEGLGDNKMEKKCD